MEDNLNNNSAVKVNRTLNSEELKYINNSKIYVNLTNLDRQYSYFNSLTQEQFDLLIETIENN